MKLRRPSIVLALGLALGGLAGAAPVVLMSVQTRDATLRAQPSPFGKPVAQVPYAERVTIVSEKDPWTEVRTPDGRTGWMHKNSLTPKQIILKAGASDVAAAASDQEVALAGKGFSKDVETQYRAQNPKLNYAAVDRMEKVRLAEPELMRFLKDGGLAAGGAQ